MNILKEYKNIVVDMTASATSYLNKIDETAYKKSQSCDPEKWAEGLIFLNQLSNEYIDYNN